MADLVGTHVSLCGHVMHTSCLESHLKDRVEGGKRGDFQCPMCRQLSNCLIPLIGVGSDWIQGGCDIVGSDSSSKNDDRDLTKDSNHRRRKPSLHSFLSTSKWWAVRNDRSVVWNGRCAFLRKGVKPVGKKDLYIAWTIVMKSPRPFLRKRKGSPESSFSPSQDNQPPPPYSVGIVGGGDLKSCSSTSLSLLQHEHNVASHAVTVPLASPQQISVVTDVWRRVMDQFADVSYKADLKRLGEARLQSNYGEFRHYLVEKVVFNNENRSAGIDIVDWPECIMPHVRYRRQELSRERLISKLLQSIQSFTYSCCAEEVECKRLGKNASSLDDTSNPLVSDIFSKYGVHKFAYGGRFLILSALKDEDGGPSQPSQFVFDGRIGRLRYLALAIMAATGVVSREIIQLSLDLPTAIHNSHSESNNSCNSVIVEPDGSDSLIGTAAGDRAPLVFPILCGHVLTHTVAAMCAACGQERAESNASSGLPSTLSDIPLDSKSKNSSGELNIVDDCEQFIQLGFLARLLQVMLGCFQNAENCSIANFPSGYELKMDMLLSQLLEKKDDGRFCHDLTMWEKGCCQLLHAAIRNTNKCAVETLLPHQDHNEDMKTFFVASKQARVAGFSFLCNAGLILQVIAPSKVSAFIDATQQKCGNDSLENLMDLVGLAPLEECMNSTLVQGIVSHWYKHATWPNKQSKDRTKQLNCPCTFMVSDWPLVESEDSFVPNESDMKPASLLPNFKKYIPLLGGSSIVDVDIRPYRPRIKALPISYTDLYAELTSLLPDSELTAVCLICGEVLDAGKGLCTKHGFECGGGCGIFFLLQDCIGLILHKEKAAYVHSPYVDSHGETPQYRGKRLNLELSRYNILHELWRGHMLRQEVISERSKTRSFLPNNFF